MAALESRQKEKILSSVVGRFVVGSLIGGLDFATGTVLREPPKLFASSEAVKAAADQCAQRAVCGINSTNGSYGSDPIDQG